MGKKIRVLHVMYGVDSGGVEAMVYNYYCHMDRKVFQFDVVAQSETGRDNSRDMFAGKLRELGANVYYILPKQENLFLCMRQFVGILKEGKYDILHIHMGHGSLPYVVCAKMRGMKHIVVHTHIAFDKTGWSTKCSTRIMGAMLRCFKTYKAACSRQAAEEAWPGKDVLIVNNAVDIQRYVPNEQTRVRIRKELGLEEGPAICAVARFVPSKNHSFLLDIFSEYHKSHTNAKLVLIGTGELEQDVRKKVNTLELEKNVLFLGARSDVPELLQAMDAFVLPSEFEGFGIVYMEAQLAGLPTYAVQGAVSETVAISDRFAWMSREASAAQWARQICIEPQNSEQAVQAARSNGFDIIQETEKLEGFYRMILEK